MLAEWLGLTPHEVWAAIAHGSREVKLALGAILAVAALGVMLKGKGSATAWFWLVGIIAGVVWAAQRFLPGYMF